MTCLGVLERGERGDDNGTSLKEGEGIEMSTTVHPFAMHALFRLNTYRYVIENSLVLFSTKLFCDRNLFKNQNSDAGAM